MTPGAYLRMRREAAGVSLDLLALGTETEPAVGFDVRRQWHVEIETDQRAIDAATVDGLSNVYAFDRGALHQLIAIHAGAKLPPPQLCRLCACSWCDPCWSEALEPCAWSTADVSVCTACEAAAAERAASEPGRVAA